MTYWKQGITLVLAVLLLATAFTLLPARTFAQSGLQQQPLDVQRDPLAERDAKHNLEVAKFYLKRKAYKAVTDRLLEITYTYPKFSRMDEVLSIIADSFLKLDNKAEAAKFYRQLVKEFPESDYSKTAKKQLESLPAEEAGQTSKTDVK